VSSIEDEASIADLSSTPDDRRKSADEALDRHASGFHAGTKRVHVRPNLHLMADLEELIEQAEALDDDDPRLDEIEAEFETVKARFDEDRALTLRALSSDLVREISRQARKDGLDTGALQSRLTALRKPKRPDLDAIEAVEDEAIEIGLRIQARLVAAMVVDEDVTEEWLVSLARTAEHEWLELSQAAGELQSNPGRVAPDFSRARSVTRRAG
jgi:hypothetical protein